MENVQKMMNYLWLLNAEVNSLNEPKMLAEECINKIDELRELKFSPGEIAVFEKEFINSLLYLRDVKERLEKLELKVNNLTDSWARG